VVDRGIGGTNPRLSAADAMVPILIVKLGVFEQEQASSGTCRLADQTEMGKGAGSLPVIVLVRDGAARGGGVEDDEVGVPGRGLGMHERPGRGSGTEGKALEVDMGVEDGRVRAAEGTPRPAEVFMAVGFAVLFVKVEDLGLGARATQEGAPVGQGHAKGDGEAALPDACLAS